MKREISSQAGLSIVEALVTMIILLVVIGGVYQIFTSNSVTNRMQTGLSRVQENGRFAIDFLSKDARMAGFMGCIANISPENFVNKLEDNNNYLYDMGIGIEGFSADSYVYPYDPGGTTGVWTDSNNATHTKSQIVALIDPNDDHEIDLVRGSDILTIRTAISDDIPVTKHPSQPASTIHTIPDHPFKLGDILLVTDCQHAGIFQVASQPSSHSITHGSGNIPGFEPGNQNIDLGKKFTEGSFYKFSTISYFVAYNEKDIPSLYRKTVHEDPQELVEGIEVLRVFYGESTTGDFNIDSYPTASSVSNWSNVRSLKIGVLAVSPFRVRKMAPDTIEHNVAGVTIGPANDDRVRRALTVTVGIRNRLK